MRLRRLTPLVILFLVTFAASCPADREPPTEEVPRDAIRLTVQVGEPHSLYDGRLRLAVTEMGRGGTWARVRLLLQSAGETVEREIRVGRNADSSEVVRLAPFVAQLDGYPGVDKVTLLVWEESS